MLGWVLVDGHLYQSYNQAPNPLYKIPLPWVQDTFYIDYG